MHFVQVIRGYGTGLHLLEPRATSSIRSLCMASAIGSQQWADRMPGGGMLRADACHCAGVRGAPWALEGQVGHPALKH